MSNAPSDLILPILMKIQEDAAALRAEMRMQFETMKANVNTRFDAVDIQFRKQRRDIAGMLVMMKGAAGVFDERITTMEQRVGALEQRQGLS